MYFTLESVPSSEMGSCAFHKDLVSVLDGVQGTGAWAGDHPFRTVHVRILHSVRFQKVCLQFSPAHVHARGGSVGALGD